MKTAMINIKTDKRVKEEAQKLAKELGFTLSSFVTASLRQFIRTRSVQFSAGYTMTPCLESILEEVEKDIKTGKNMSPKFTTAKAANAYLRSLK